jgi:glycerophosphoryl diester phosphodiesterase
VTTPTVLPRAFAHRDHAHPFPLDDALSLGFPGIEVDVWLRDGVLLVGHDEAELDPAVTLAGAYLEPLAARVRTRTLLPGWSGSFLLVLDVKSEATATWRALSALLADHVGMLTTWRGGREYPGAVTVLISGNRARTQMARQRVRHAGYDGRLPDLRRHWFRRPGPELVPLVSADWQRVIGWDGASPLSRRSRRRLARIVSDAHQQGRKIRFWATPDAGGDARAAIWALLCDVGVDYLNTDDLRGLADFLLARHDIAHPPADSAGPSGPRHAYPAGHS